MLTTHYGFFMTSVVDRNPKNSSAHTERIVEILKQAGHHVIVCKFEDIKHVEDYKEWFVLYSSSEDPGLFYKDYIEDIILRLHLAGAILLPRFELFRCHHNKCFMEGYRLSLEDDRFKTIKSYIYGSYGGYLTSSQRPEEYPVVLKPSVGAGSSGVVIANDSKDLEKKIKKLARRQLYIELPGLQGLKFPEKLKNMYRGIRGIPRVNYPPKAFNFVVQNLIPNLSGDYKVLVFGEKYYLLKRENRDGDFRASGSGKYSFPSDVADVRAVLDYAKLAYETFNTHICSLDIGYDGVSCHLIEFQFLHFGPITLQKSAFHFIFKQNEWVKVDEIPNLEREYSHAVLNYLTCLESKEALNGNCEKISPNF